MPKSGDAVWCLFREVYDERPALMGVFTSIDGAKAWGETVFSNRSVEWDGESATVTRAWLDADMALAIERLELDSGYGWW